jgi:hypothetical protein
MFGISLKGITFPITWTFKRILQALALLASGQAKTISAYRKVSNAKDKKMVETNEILEVLSVKLTHKRRLQLAKLFR